MKYTEKNGFRVSMFSLGTVQLGMNYGVNNKDGKPSREKAYEILDTAKALGVNCLDTAAGYGDSEATIGAWLEQTPVSERPAVVTKVDFIDHSSKAAIRSSLRESVETSKKRLGQEKLPLLMIHNFEHYAQNPDEVNRAFEELRAAGDIERWGISAYSRHDYRLMADSSCDAVQIPQNIFDWSQIKCGGIDALAESGKTVFVRSVFLQGLVFMDPEHLHPQMEFAAPYLKKYRELCTEFSLEPATLAMSFVLSLPGMSSLVLGCEKKEQVEANAALIEKTVQLSDTQMDAIRTAFEDCPSHLINPGTWYNA